jgi:hypothetical protein
MQACLDLEYRRSIVLLHLARFDEMDEISRSGSAELHRDGWLAIAFVLKAERATSSATC